MGAAKLSATPAGVEGVRCMRTGGIGRGYPQPPAILYPCRGRTAVLTRSCACKPLRWLFFWIETNGTFAFDEREVADITRQIRKGEADHRVAVIGEDGGIGVFVWFEAEKDNALEISEHDVAGRLRVQ